MDLKVRRKAIMTNEVERPMYRSPIYRPTAGNKVLDPEMPKSKSRLLAVCTVAGVGEYLGT